MIQSRVEAGGITLSVFLLALAWLVPDHYFPWLASHGDWLAGLGLCFAVVGVLLAHGAVLRVPAIACAAFGLAVVAGLQWAGGLIYFGGDALMAALYLTGFALAVVVGSSVTDEARVVDAFCIAFVSAGLASAAIAVLQWLRVDLPDWVPMVSVSRGARPGANVAQPNQLATLLVLTGIFAAVLLERARLSAFWLAVVLGLLLPALAITQSRAGQLELAGVVVGLWWLRGRAELRLQRRALVVLVVVFAALTLALPWFSDQLLLSARDVAEAGVSVDRRLLHWAAVADAVGRRPLTGYGWNQVAVAMSAVAAERPASQETIEHSHNLLLDLLAWNGIPLGMLVIAGLAWWFWRRLRRARDGTSALLLAGIGAVLLHAMVEFPLDYAYVLLPVGLMVGLLERDERPMLASARWPVAAVAAAALVVFAWISAEYVEVEANTRQLRFESARIGSVPGDSEAPDIVLLTQLREYLRFARTEARPGMSAEQLDWMRRVAERYSYPPVLFRYALASALNGRGAVAHRVLDQLCRTQAKRVCAEARGNWERTAATRYPVLAEVSFPTPP